MRIIGEHRTEIYGVSCQGKFVVAVCYVDVIVWKDGKRAWGFGVSPWPAGGHCWMAAMSKDGTVAACFGRSLRLRNGKRQRQLAQLGSVVTSLAWSADGKRLLTGQSPEKTIRVWQDGKEIWQGKTKKSAASFVAFSGDGKRALSGGGDKLIHVWDIEKNRERTLAGHSGKILGLSMVENRAASASQDRTARTWDLKKMAPLATLVGHKKQVLGVALSPDGNQVATVSGDRTLRIWNARSGEELRCERLEDAPASVAWGEEIVVAAGKKILAF